MECGESWEHGAGRPGNMERGGLGTWSGEAPGNKAKDVALVVQ